MYEADAYTMWSDSLFPLTGLDEAAAQGEAYFVRLNGPGRAAEEYIGEAARAQAAACVAQAPADAQVSIEVLDALSGESAAVMFF